MNSRETGVPHLQIAQVLIILLLSACTPDVSDAARSRAEAANKTGLLHFQAAAYVRALPHFLDAHKTDPQNPEYPNNAGMSYLRMGEIPRAAEYFQKAVVLKPDVAMYHYNMGLTFHSAGDYEPALAAFLKAIRINKDYFDAHAYAGLIYYNAGKYKMRPGTSRTPRRSRTTPTSKRTWRRPISASAIRTRRNRRCGARCRSIRTTGTLTTTWESSSNRRAPWASPNRATSASFNSRRIASRCI